MVLELSREVRRRHVGLWLVGALNLVLAAVFLALVLVDDRAVTGLNVWIKPLKFAVSVGVYLWTVAWFLPHLRVSGWVARGLGWAVAAAMLFENLLIFSQAVRGTSSHFNFSTAYDASIFSAMGLMIAVNTVLATILMILYFARPGEIPKPYLWGIRLGFLVLILGSAVGSLMITHGSHAVGVADGGPGLPFLGWSAEAGDLRPAHLVFLHGLQVLPLAGYWLSRRREWTVARQTATLLAFSTGYALLGLLLLWQALAGRPLVAL